MFWLYIPPIIFIGALVALVVIMGKKTSVLKRGEISRPRPAYPATAGAKAGRMRNYGMKIVESFKAAAQFFKTVFKKSENMLSDVLAGIKERRTARKAGTSLPEETSGTGEEYFGKNSEEMNIDHKMKDSDVAIIGKDGEIKTSEILFEEVIVRRKPEAPPQRIVPEKAAENKVKEDALIHRIAENPRDVEAYREIGDYYLGIGSLKDAKDSFKMVLKLRPRDLKAKSSLREIETRMRLGEKL